MTLNAAGAKALRGTLTTTEDEEPRTNLELYLAAKFHPLTPGQRKRVKKTVVVPNETGGFENWESPADLYDTDPDFKLYVGDAVRWAAKLPDISPAVRRTRAIGAICNYTQPTFGWVKWKEIHGGREKKDDPSIRDSRDDSAALWDELDRLGREVQG